MVVFLLTKEFTIADFVTLGNSTCGSLSILSSLKYITTQSEYYLYFSMSVLPIALFMDIMDG